MSAWGFVRKLRSSEEIMKITRLRRILLVVLSVAASSSALPQKKYGPGASDTATKIGQTYPYSGPLSGYATIARAEAGIFAKIRGTGTAISTFSWGKRSKASPSIPSEMPGSLPRAET